MKLAYEINSQPDDRRWNSSLDCSCFLVLPSHTQTVLVFDTLLQFYLLWPSCQYKGPTKPNTIFEKQTLIITRNQFSKSTWKALYSLGRTDREVDFIQVKDINSLQNTVVGFINALCQGHLNASLLLLNLHSHYPPYIANYCHANKMVWEWCTPEAWSLQAHHAA